MEARGQSLPQHVWLRIDATAPGLHAIPWELVRDAASGMVPQTLDADAAMLFSYYRAASGGPTTLSLAGPCRCWWPSPIRST